VTRIAWDDEYLSRKGMVLRCKLLEPLNPLIPPLRIRISTRYPDEQPEILSLTETIPPKLEFTGKEKKEILLIEDTARNLLRVFFYLIKYKTIKNKF